MLSEKQKYIKVTIFDALKKLNNDLGTQDKVDLYTRKKTNRTIRSRI